MLRLQLEKRVTHWKIEISHNLLLVEQGAEETPQSLSDEHSQLCGWADLCSMPTQGQAVATALAALQGPVLALQSSQEDMSPHC